MSPSSRAAPLAKGRERYQREQRQAAIQRVLAYQRWLASGTVTKNIPRELPTDADYRIARKAGRVK